MISPTAPMIKSAAADGGSARAALALLRGDQRMAGHRRRLLEAEHVEQGRRDVGEPAIGELGDSPGGLTTSNGTGFRVCAVCGSPVSGSRIISALP